jgi:serine/threonine protein phosphatase PrpC
LLSSGGGDTPKKGFKKLERKPATELSEKQRGEKPAALKLKYGILPSLDKKASRTRLARRDEEESGGEAEVTAITSQTSVQVTNKIPISSTTVRGGIFGRGSNPVTNPRLPNKSLPRLAAGKKVDKLSKNKDQDSTDERSIRDQTENDTDVPEKLSLLLSTSTKTMAGFSEGKTKTNQDSVFCCPNLKGSGNSSLFAVFDGHGTLGHKVSSFLKLHIGDSIELRFDPQKTYDQQGYTSIMESACLDVNTKLSNNALINTLLSGSTGIVVLLHNDKIVCGNVGDSRAGVVCFSGPEDSGSLEMLSVDHTPNDPVERDRILNAGGKVMPCIGTRQCNQTLSDLRSGHLGSGISREKAQD